LAQRTLAGKIRESVSRVDDLQGDLRNQGRVGSKPWIRSLSALD